MLLHRGRQQVDFSTVRAAGVAEQSLATSGFLTEVQSIAGDQFEQRPTRHIVFAFHPVLKRTVLVHSFT